MIRRRLGHGVRRRRGGASARRALLALTTLAVGCGGAPDFDAEAEGANLQPQVTVEHPIDAPTASAASAAPTGERAAAGAAAPAASVAAPQPPPDRRVP